MLNFHQVTFFLQTLAAEPDYVIGCTNVLTSMSVT